MDGFGGSQGGVITPRVRARLIRKIDVMEKALRAIGKKKNEAAGEILTDWHDNFSYEQFDREFQMLSKRISEINATLSGSQVIEVLEQSDRVMIGSTVEFLMNGTSIVLTVGCVGESEPDLDLVAYVSPLGQLLMGLTTGSVKKGRVGQREVELRVTRILPPSSKYAALQDQLDNQSLEPR
jgi:transcription elongation GreA/GreB family factor